MVECDPESGHPCPAPRYTTLLRAVELWRSVQADGPGRLAGDEEPPPGDGLVVRRKQDLSQQPTCADGAPLWVKMVALRAGLAEPLDGDRVEAGKSAVACDPDKQSGPRCAEVPFFVAPGTRESTRGSVSNVPVAPRSPVLIAE